MNNYFDSVAAEWDSNPAKIERATATAQQIKQLSLASYDSVVDFGAGTGLLGVQLRDLFQCVHLADASNNMLEIAQQKIAQAQLTNVHTHFVESLADIPGSHSAIVTLMTLHHIHNVGEFFASAYQKLQAQGMLVIADLYAEDGSFHKHNPDFDGHNGFDLDELCQKAKQAGFTITKAAPYYDIRQENRDGVDTVYPLFLLAVMK